MQTPTHRLENWLKTWGARKTLGGTSGFCADKCLFMCVGGGGRHAQAAMYQVIRETVMKVSIVGRFEKTTGSYCQIV